MYSLPNQERLTGLRGEISNNHGNNYVRSRDRHTSYQDECKTNYMRVGREIEQHSLADREHQENQWAMRANVIIYRTMMSKACVIRLLV